jgi:hypothetical protein
MLKIAIMVNAQPLSATTYVDTPLGRLKFYTDIVGGQVTDLKLVQGKLEPILPTGMSVSACFAVFLQFSVAENATGFKFHCDWEDFDGKGYASTGEGLDAWGWEHHNHLVMVGTEDADWLNGRIPLAPFTPNAYPITMDENKMEIRLNELPEGRSCSLHFIVAWNPFPEPRECSCWYAVDVPHKVVTQRLANAG